MRAHGGISAILVAVNGERLLLGDPPFAPASAAGSQVLDDRPEWDSVPWLMARASGLVAFGLLTGSIWLGLAMSTRLLGGKRQAALLAGTVPLSASALTMLVVHVGAVLLDPVISFGRSPFSFRRGTVALHCGGAGGDRGVAVADPGGVVPLTRPHRHADVEAAPLRGSSRSSMIAHTLTAVRTWRDSRTRC